MLSLRDPPDRMCAQVQHGEEACDKCAVVRVAEGYVLLHDDARQMVHVRAQT